jgi:chromosome segregation ATPase
MNTPTPTPRTDTEITFTGAYTHTCGELSCDECNARTAALRAERDHWQEIAKTMSAEREHNANVAQEMTAERDQLRAELERADVIYQRACEVEHGLRAEVERLHRAAGIVGEAFGKAEADLAAAKERLRSEAMDDYASIKDLQRELTILTAERDQLTARAERAEAAETVALAHWNGALERALKAEADLAALEQCHDDNCRAVVKIAAELATMKEGAK